MSVVLFQRVIPLQRVFPFQMHYRRSTRHIRDHSSRRCFLTFIVCNLLTRLLPAASKIGRYNCDIGKYLLTATNHLLTEFSIIMSFAAYLSVTGSRVGFRFTFLRAIWAQYGIDLPGSLHTNKIPAILGRYPLLVFFCRLNIVPLDRDDRTFNSSHTDVVEKVNFLVAASQHGGTSVAEGSP